QLLQEHTAEPALLLGYAECCLTLAEIGDPAAKGTQIHDLATALAAYEQALNRENPNDADGPWVKADYSRRANRPALARAEIARLLARFPDHEGGLALAAQLAMEDGTPESCRAAQPFIDALKKKQPNAPLPLLLQAQQQSALGQKDAAKLTLETCVRQCPTCAAGYAALVELAFEKNDLNAAMPVIRAWRQALPTDAMAMQAEIRHAAAIGRLDRAKSLFQEALALAEKTGVAQSSAQAKSAITLTLCRGLLLARPPFVRDLFTPSPAGPGADQAAA